MTTRVERKAETRALIVETAKALFSSISYADVDMRLIAERAKLSTGAVYSNFDAKADLFAEAMGKPAPVGRLQDAAPDLLIAAKALLAACHEDFGVPVNDLDLDDEPVGHSDAGPCAVQFGHMRAMQAAISKAEGR